MCIPVEQILNGGISAAEICDNLLGRRKFRCRCNCYVRGNWAL